MSDLKRDFIAIFADARDSGMRSFESLIAENPKLLSVNRKMYPKEMEIYENLTEGEREKFKVILKFFMQMSFVSLIEKLELGDGGVTFTLTAHNESSGEKFDLINEESDLDLRNEFQN